METFLAYTDGSAHLDKIAAWAYIIAKNNSKNNSKLPEEVNINNISIIHQDSGILTGEICQTRNIGAELHAVKEAVKWAVENNAKIVICHDLQGISLWADGSWKTNNQWTREYKKFVQKYKDHILGYIWTKGHALDVLNNKVDKLAGETLSEGLEMYEKKNL